MNWSDMEYDEFRDYVLNHPLEAADRIAELEAERNAALATLAKVRADVLGELETLGYGDGSGIGTFNRLTDVLRRILDGEA